MKFKLKFYTSIPRLLAMEVLEMHEELIKNVETIEVAIIYKNNKFLICSGYYPFLKENAICLRGLDRIYNNSIKSICFNSEQEKQDYLEKVLECIQEYAESIDNSENWKSLHIDNINSFPTDIIKGIDKYRFREHNDFVSKTGYVEFKPKNYIDLFEEILYSDHGRYDYKPKSSYKAEWNKDKTELIVEV